MPLAASAGCASSAHGSTAASSEAAPGATPATVPPQSATTQADLASLTAEDARQFATRVNDELKRLWVKQATADWIKSTYITDDTERNSASVNEEVMAYLSQAIPQAARFKDVKGVDAESARVLRLLRLSSMLPAPNEPAQRAELASIAAKLEGLYGKGKYCGKDGKGACKDLGELSDVMATNRDYNTLLEAWVGWHTISQPMRPLYERLVTLSNAGAQEIDFKDTGALWRSNYDMPPEAFEQEAQRLWGQVKPLYDDLHCYVRARLAKQYGEDKVPAGKAIPAHLLGNMWAQEWNNIYGLVEPYKGQPSLDVDAELKKQKYDALRMVKLGEGFFTSLGLKPLPETFWQNSQFTKPRDREVVCHASAWDVTYNNDLRIKMCIKPTEEDLVTIHHELGHNYYYTYYYKLPVLFQQGANDGFHEAIGDAITLSITPSYLKQMGLLKDVPTGEKGLINLQMKDAMEKVAFLPFGLLVDQWRWEVFSGRVKPADYNASWWALREKYQGVRAPVERSEKDFDAGAKYHVPANVPYTRYFLARILQFQFHRALCQAAGHQGPLHECSIYGNKEAGKRLQAMLELGASKPWPEALAALTGQRDMDASAMLEYFTPLRRWLQEQNKGQQCGW
ncbi:Peptidyl-dipeptidase A precursor [Cystobacter fuscus DSM 2262]|uniref:Peptidyl-dipeptidase A n=1 Tax=Cystobacter fuscus (strain ATCC 25194 / DSM 2262 / NBRC 100088 / M29) TaxID=1242864 RepID=S9P293_CYSF2|nr:Peptidyl-dipeptidase A precursor [Cystobacter fuscus DSM 2262]